jgi:hypothetical protein
MNMLPTAKEKEPERYYLLAGMGGRAARRKHQLMLRWAIITGVVVSIGLATLMYLLNHHWS